MSSERDELIELLTTALNDDASQRLREELCIRITEALAANALRLHIHHTIGGDAAGIGFAAITEMAAELSKGAVSLYQSGKWYPGAALVRQLLECGYLLALVGDDPSEAEAWLRSTPRAITENFMPRHTRGRATHRFRVEEYRSHCSRGGHPSPAGRGLLPNYEYTRPFSVRLLGLTLPCIAAKSGGGS